MAAFTLVTRVCGLGPRGRRGLGSQALPSARTPDVRTPSSPGCQCRAPSPSPSSPTQGPCHHAQGRAPYLITTCGRSVVDATLSSRPKQYRSWKGTFREAAAK
uniref:Uncharacterized protein n=1 Tax=Cacopsylla melanoneura TaxID=428564 RepID=A0A8D9E4S2_9HEMI